MSAEQHSGGGLDSALHYLNPKNPTLQGAFIPLVAGCAFFACIFGGIGLFAWQILTFAQTGQWESYSMINLFMWLFDGDRKAMAWLTAPSSWIGVWKVFDFIPAVLGLFAAGTFITLGSQAD